jgi:nucleoside-diphosphate-sugar epimerase
MVARRSHRFLVFGATGQIGSELVPEMRKRYGAKNVIAVGHQRKPPEAFLEAGPFEIIDLGSERAVLEAAKRFDVDTVYHLAAMLSVTGESDPRAAWMVNLDSLRSVLEVARRLELRLFWPSSIAVFGPSAPRVMTPQETVLFPTSMYGVTKVAGELLCNYYHHKYGLDVRSVRYPGIISSETPPGGGTTDYAVAFFYDAIQKGSYTCFVRQDTVLPMMYMPDCIEAAITIMEAPGSSVKRRDAYNITGMSFSAKELELEIRKHLPSFRAEYEPDARQRIADSWPMSIDDSEARNDWGWCPKYGLTETTKDMIERLRERLAPQAAKAKGTGRE